MPATQVRPRAIPLRELTRLVRAHRGLPPDDRGAPLDRPRTRGECADLPRPCPYVSCKFHLYLDVMEDTGSLKMNFPGVDPEVLEDMPVTCALDAADEGPQTLEDIGRSMSITRERVRQLEVGAARKFHRAMRRVMSRGSGPPTRGIE